ncbi:MAG: tetratricopeptide repeat protein [Planctomycetes bacterium]|nr:tetratricopeptide repeat protein [Planctomycetota bacterium]
MLTRILLAGIALTAVSAQVQADDAAAIAAYRRGDMATARTEWTALLDADGRAPQGAERARILYDLGNVSFREGRTLEAVAWYTASLRLRPRDADTWANLEEARSRSKLEPAYRGDLSSTLKRVVRSLTGAEAGWLALSGLLLLAAALAFEAVRGGRYARWTAVLAALTACVMCIPWLDHSVRDGSQTLMVIQPDGASVRSEPRASAAVTSELSAAAVVEHVDELPDWTKVRLEGGLEGWVQKRSVFPLAR